MTRDELADRLAVLKREDWPRLRLDHFIARGETDRRAPDALRLLLEAAENPDYATLIANPISATSWAERAPDAVGTARSAGATSTARARARAAGPEASSTTSPTRTATCNSYRVCDRPRGEHELVVAGYSVDSPEPRYELRCPDPKPVPGLAAAYTFPSSYHAPEIVRFTALLWVHPYEVHLRPKKDEDGGD